MCFLFYLFKKEKNRKLHKVTIKYYLKLLIVLCSVMIIIWVIEVFDLLETSNKGKTIILLIYFLGIIFLIIAIWFMQTVREIEYCKHEIDNMGKQMRIQEQYVDTLEIKNDVIKNFRHDFRGHTIILQKYIENKEYDLAEKYLEKMNNIIKNSVQEYTGIVVVDAVISDVCKCMPHKGITLNWKGRIKGCEKKITEYDLCIIFMNIMSNAIEACEKTEKNKEINVMVKYTEDEIYIFENNFINGELKKDKKGNLLTQKSDKETHGIGSRNIREVVKKYNGELEYGVKNREFYIIIII